MELPGTVARATEASADPGAVRVALERLADARPGVLERLEADAHLCSTVVAVCAASRSLTTLLAADPDALETLADLDRRPEPTADDEESLVDWKRRELLRLAARDLGGLDGFEAVAAGLSALAADVLDAAVALTGAEELAVVGMGKLGGGELNYASDIDVMFVGRDPETIRELERTAREVVRVARQCFRIDANLRPEGRDGPLVRTVDAYRAYWDRWAEPWEFQALLKARPVAGDQVAAAEFRSAAHHVLWTRVLDADALRSLRSMKARAEREVERRRLADREIKRGPGGIRDIEFSVQLLQLVHGRHDPHLRSPTTLTVLAELGAAGYVDAADADRLADAYRFLRTVEHRLQLVDEQQVHTVPTDTAARTRLARVLGWRDSPDGSAADLFHADLRATRAAVRAIHERLWFRPMLEAFAGAEAAMSPEAIEARLAAFGFSDAERTRQAVRELTRGLTRSSRLMSQLLPVLLGWLADTPDPDLGLLGLRTLASGPQRSVELARAFRESPEVARRLCTVVGTSRLLMHRIEHNPDLIGDLGDDEALRPRDRATLLEAAASSVEWRGDTDARRTGLKRFTDREGLRISCGDVLDQTPLPEVGEGLSTLAEAALETSLAALAPPLPFAIVALGRFGGRELSYASDLDVLFVYEGDGAADFRAAEEVATAVVRFVGGRGSPTRIYDVDPDLRPEGRDGPLARSMAGYRTYYERWARTWERQALVRARPVAGDAELGRRFVGMVDPWVFAGLDDDGVREIRRMKARVERERIPAGEDPDFHLKLGPGSLSDVEWTAQYLQLRHGVRAPDTIAALDALVAAGHLAADDRRVLFEAYRFCERTRNRWFLIKGTAVDSLPQRTGDLARLARSLDTSPVELREEYRRVTRRARRVVERVFYGAPAGGGGR